MLPARELRLQAVRGVIKAGVDHAAVAPARMEAARGFFFDQRYGGVGETMFEFAGDADPDDPAADDEEIRGRSWL